MNTEPPSHTSGHIDHESLPPTNSTGPTSGINPPHADHIQSRAQQLHINVQIKQTVGLPAELEDLPKRISKAPPCETSGHKHGHKVRHEASDQGHARPPPLQSKYYTRQNRLQKR